MDFKDLYNLKLRKLTEELLTLISIRQEKFSLWLRNIIAMVVGFLGITVGLKNHPIKNILHYYFYNLQLLSLITGILSGTIRLFSDIHLLDDERQIRGQNLIKCLDNEKVSFITTIKKRKPYKIAEKVCYISFLLALICVLIVSLFRGYN